MKNKENRANARLFCSVRMPIPAQIPSIFLANFRAMEA